MHRVAYPVMNQGPSRLGSTSAYWEAGFQSLEIVEYSDGAVAAAPPAPEPATASEEVYPEEEVYSSSITRPACACKILNGKRMGQGGCAVPTEGFPGASVAKVNGNGDGLSTGGIVGGLTVLGVLGLIAGGVI